VCLCLGLKSKEYFVRGTTAVRLRSGAVDIDAETGSITKTFSTAADIDLFLSVRDGGPALACPSMHLRATRRRRQWHCLRLNSPWKDPSP